MCYYYRDKDSKKYFWKYNKKARELALPVAKNNAANGYFRGEYKKQNLKKALKLYQEALSDKSFEDKGDHAANQIKKIKNLLHLQ